MKLKEVLDAFEAGMRIKRKDWENYSHIGEWRCICAQCNWQLSLESICADDWEIEPDKKEQLTEKVISAMNEAYEGNCDQYEKAEKELIEFIEKLEIK